MRDRVWHIIFGALLAAVVAYAAAVLFAYSHDHAEHIDAARVSSILAQRLTDADLDEEHLPPDPDPAQVDATIDGVDANGNGVRDDVELSIAATYPASTSVSAAELQYAMSLQTQLTQVSDTPTWKAAEQMRDRAFECLVDVSPQNYSTMEQDVDALVINTVARTDRYNDIERFRTSYELLAGPDCDLRRDGAYE